VTRRLFANTGDSSIADVGENSSRRSRFQFASAGPPRSWRDVLAAPAFVINLDARPERLTSSLEELRRAGFTDVRRFQAVDAANPKVLEQAWVGFGSPKFAPWDAKFREFSGKQGCFLSHVKLWEEIADSGLQFGCIFEDDIFFHRLWSQLSPTYFEFTPRDYDILFLGSQIEIKGTGLVRRVPVHCMHGYLVTNDGARRLRSILLNDPNGVATIDSMVMHYQWLEHQGHQRAPFDWYVWDGTTFPDLRAKGHPLWEIRNAGLVFQNFAFESDIEKFGSPGTLLEQTFPYSNLITTMHDVELLDEAGQKAVNG
jgi:hypothetical protein